MFSNRCRPGSAVLAGLAVVLLFLACAGAQADQIADLKEAPVVDFMPRGAPVGETIGLVLKQLMQGVETVRRAGPAVLR